MKWKEIIYKTLPFKKLNKMFFLLRFSFKRLSSNSDTIQLEV